MDSPAAFSDSYVIIKNDYDFNNAYVSKDRLDMVEQLNHLLLDIELVSSVDFGELITM